MKPRSFNNRWSLLLIPVLLLLNGCPFITDSGGKKPPPPPPSDYFALTSISNVIANLKKAYPEMNYPEYAKLLHDEFEYVFAPEDVGGQNNIPESWGKADELLSTEHLFSKQENKDHFRADRITLTFVTGPEETTPIDPSWTLVKLTQIQLNVDSTNSQGEQLIYEVVGDQAYLYFKQTDETDPTSGKKLWKIIRWEDKPIGAVGIAAKI